MSALVQPRLVDLRGLFDDGGRMPGESRRFLMRRPSGFDLHSVREYEQGESLRRVHWPTTARRGQLMVKELEDSPRESLVVVLDCDPAGDAGTSPDSSFDDAVRAAGSILRVHVLRGRRCALVTTAQADCATRASSHEGEFASVLGTLAAVQADAPGDLARFLERPPRAVDHAPEVVVVTASESPAAARKLLDFANRRAVAVVWVDAASYVGRPTRAAPAVLQLSAAGIPIAAIRHGADLAAALEARHVEVRASG